MNLSKKTGYYNFTRKELVNMISPEGSSFLEIGCGAGATLEYLKSKGASFVAGIDKNEEAIKLASGKGLDFLSVADVEEEELPFREKEFDCIIFADVLEHLFNPWEVLKKISRHLKDDGYVLISLPNIKHYSILWR